MVTQDIVNIIGFILILDLKKKEIYFNVTMKNAKANVLMDIFMIEMMEIYERVILVNKSRKGLSK